MEPDTQLNKPCWLGLINHTLTMTFTFFILPLIPNNHTTHCKNTCYRFILSMQRLMKITAIVKPFFPCMWHFCPAFFFPSLLINFHPLAHRGLGASIRSSHASLLDTGGGSARDIVFITSGTWRSRRCQIFAHCLEHLLSLPQNRGNPNVSAPAKPGCMHQEGSHRWRAGARQFHHLAFIHWGM